MITPTWTLRREAEVLLSDLVAVVAQAVSNEIDHAEVRNRDVGRRCNRRLELTQGVVFNGLSARMEHEGQGAIVLATGVRKSGVEWRGGGL